MPPAPALAASRPAAVAGLFYPAAPGALSRDVDAAIGEAHHASLPVPKALIVPHAGYVYSGSTAGAAYALLRRAASTIARVVLLGPCHRVAVAGIAVPTVDAFATPLGPVPIDRAALRTIGDLPQVVHSDAAHAREHALEVQLPFLQRVLRAFSVVPLAVGDAAPGDVAGVIERLWGGPETLIVVSSDLSHYLPYDQARARDDATTQAILRLDTTLDHDDACGATPIAGLLAVAKRRGLAPTLVALCNSGDTAGDRQRVVGYAAFAFHETDADVEPDDQARGASLLALARAAIHEALGGPPPVVDHARWLDRPGACFVTLRQEEQLRGCVGSLEALRPLRDDVIANARAAARSDPRFAPLRADELAATRIEVSLLDPPTPLPADTREALLDALTPRLDGVTVTWGRTRATFLPQVWEAVPDAATFVDELMRKAGIDPGTPLRDCRFERYRVRKWAEPQLRP